MNSFLLFALHGFVFSLLSCLTLAGVVGPHRTIDCSSKWTSTTATTSPLPFTSVTATAYTSGSTCYALPTPTSSLQKLSLARLNSTGPTVDSVYMGDNFTIAKYMNVLDENGKSYLIDMSIAGQVGVTDENGTTLVFDSKGIHLATEHCAIGIDLLIPKFVEQLNALGNSSSVQTRSLQKRFTETDFQVEVDLVDQCKNPLKDYVPRLWIGPTECGYNIGDRIPGQWTWTCHFPGEYSKEMKCEDTWNHFLNYLLGGVIGSTTNWSTVGQKVRAFLARFAPELAASLGLEAAAAAVAIEAVAPIIAALAFAEIFQVAWTVVFPEGLAQDICWQYVGKYEFPLPLTVDVIRTDYQITKLEKAPDPVTATVPISVPTIHCNPPSGPRLTSVDWTFRLTESANIPYLEFPAALYQSNNALLLKETDNVISVNTACIRVVDTVSTYDFLPKDEPYYFGWDSVGEDTAKKDDCLIWFFENSNCLKRTGASDFWASQGGVVKSRLPFNVYSWEVTDCKNVYQP